jgi:predicted helicase
MQHLIETYNDTVVRWRHAGLSSDAIDSFVTDDETLIGWSGDLKAAVVAGELGIYDASHVRKATYRPFATQYVHFDRLFDNSVYKLPFIWPSPSTERENVAIWLKVGTEWPMFALAVSKIPDVLPSGGPQALPFYIYAGDGTNRRENITDWALEQFRSRYGNPSMPSCITPSTASATPPISAASCRAFHS